MGRDRKVRPTCGSRSNRGLVRESFRRSRRPNRLAVKVQIPSTKNKTKTGKTALGLRSVTVREIEEETAETLQTEMLKVRA